MQYTRLGTSGLKVSRIALGTMGFGDGSRETWALDYDAAVPFFRQALDLGHHLLGHRQHLRLRQLREGRRPGGQGARPARRHRPGDEGAPDRARGPRRVRACPARRSWSRSTPRSPGWAPTTSTCTRSTASTPRPRSRRRWRRCTTWSRPARPATSVRRACGRGSSPRCSTPPTSRGWTAFVSMQDQYSLIHREEEREMFGLLADQGVGSLPVEPAGRGIVAPAVGRPSTTRGQDSVDVDFNGSPLWLDTDKAIVDAIQRDRADPRRVHGPDRAGLGAEAPRRRLAHRGRHQGPPPVRRGRRARHRSSPTTRSTRSKTPTSPDSPPGSDPSSTWLHPWLQPTGRDQPHFAATTAAR